MKTQITLRGLQIASAAFLAVKGAEAEKIFCANAERKVVSNANCDGNAPADTFFMFSSKSEYPVGTTVGSEVILQYDSALFFQQRHAVFPADIPFEEFESRGFGKRQCGSGDEGSNGG